MTRPSAAAAAVPLGCTAQPWGRPPLSPPLACSGGSSMAPYDTSRTSRLSRALSPLFSHTAEQLMGGTVYTLAVRPFPLPTPGSASASSSSPASAALGALELAEVSYSNSMKRVETPVYHALLVRCLYRRLSPSPRVSLLSPTRYCLGHTAGERRQGLGRKRQLAHDARRCVAPRPQPVPGYQQD